MEQHFLLPDLPIETRKIGEEFKYVYHELKQPIIAQEEEEIQIRLFGLISEIPK